MAFPPTNAFDVNSWLPYADNRTGPFQPRHLRDAFAYTYGSLFVLHHLDFVILQNIDQQVSFLDRQQIAFWTQIRHDITKLMTRIQFYHRHVQGQTLRDGLSTDFLYNNIDSRAQEAVEKLSQSASYIRRHQHTPSFLKQEKLFEVTHPHPFMPRVQRRHSW